MLGATGFSLLISAHDNTPGFRCGKQPGLLQHQDAHRTHVLQRRVVAGLVQPRPCLWPPVLGPSPSVNSASLQPRAAPSRATLSTSSAERNGACPLFLNRVGVVTNVQ